MTSYLDGSFFGLLRFLDRVRGYLLRKTLHFPFFRTLYTDRAIRLGALFVLACCLYLPLCLAFPLWIAVWGPMVYGVPHIVASLRYAHHQTSANVRGYFVAVWIAVSAVRVLIDTGAIVFTSNFTLYDLELLSWVASLVLILFFVGRSRNSLAWGALALGALLFTAWRLPLELSAFLLLAHNLVAFFFWIKKTTTRRELAVALASMLVFTALSVGIMCGAFDWTFAFLKPSGQLLWLGFDYADLGQSLAPWSPHYEVWFRFFVAYVFGQSLHYFVWLKAIPEQVSPRDAPVSFCASGNLLKREFSGRVFLFVLTASLAGLTYWCFFSYPLARMIYFSISAYHGFFEIAALIPVPGAAVRLNTSHDHR
jgi:hypothetical protein